VHPLPPHQEALTLGFPITRRGARFTANAQLHERFRNCLVTVRLQGSGRASQHGTSDGNSMPGFCLSLDLRGDPREIAADRLRLVDQASRFAGGEFAPFDEIFCRKLRRDFKFSGRATRVISRVRCALC
jgi:hypothetical protein